MPTGKTKETSKIWLLSGGDGEMDEAWNTQEESSVHSETDIFMVLLLSSLRSLNRKRDNMEVFYAPTICKDLW